MLHAYTRSVQLFSAFIVLSCQYRATFIIQGYLKHYNYSLYQTVTHRNWCFAEGKIPNDWIHFVFYLSEYLNILWNNLLQPNWDYYAMASVTETFTPFLSLMCLWTLCVYLYLDHFSKRKGECQTRMLRTSKVWFWTNVWVAFIFKRTGEIVSLHKRFTVLIETAHKLISSTRINRKYF